MEKCDLLISANESYQMAEKDARNWEHLSLAKSIFLL